MRRCHGRAGFPAATPFREIQVFQNAEIFKGDFSIQARLLPVEHLSFPQFDVRNAKTADV
jgi:hypothetical protein